MKGFSGLSLGSVGTITGLVSQGSTSLEGKLVVSPGLVTVPGAKRLLVVR